MSAQVIGRDAATMMADDALWASLKELRDATETDLMVVGQDPKTPRRGIGSKGL